MTKRIRFLFWAGVTLSAFGFEAGCSCDPSITSCPEGEYVCADPSFGAMCVPYDPSLLCTFEQIGSNGGFCPEGMEVYDEETCTFDCGTNGSACDLYELQKGYMAQYLDSVTVATGTDQEFVAISGYSPGWLSETDGIYPFGDLVYAEFTPGGPEIVDWEILDGKPADTPDNIYFDPASWRNGNSEPGDDVGMYSSITASAAGDVYIAYADVTRRGDYALKLAHRPAGETEFVISVIDDTDPIGNGGAFYPSITLDPAGNPVVAYGVRQAATVAGAQPTGWVRVATAANAAPAATDWTFVELTETTTDIGCVDTEGLCAMGDRCFAAGTSGRGYCATPDTDCRDAVTNEVITCSGQFGTTSLCVADACQNVKGGGDLVDTTGISNNLFPITGGFGLVFHDRGAGFHRATPCETNAQCTATDFCTGVVTPAADNDGHCMRPNGNLWGMRYNAGTMTWSSMFLIDGYSRKRPNIGDCGLHASVAVEADGDWHVAYLDGTFDRVRYARITNNTTARVNLSTAANVCINDTTVSCTPLGGTPAACGGNLCVANTQFGDETRVIDDGTADYYGTSRPADRLDGRRRLVGGEISIAVTATGEVRVLYQDITGMTNADSSVTPPGAQPLLAIGSATGTPGTWPVRYADDGVINGGYWTTQSLGITTTTPETSYCVWAARSSSDNNATAAAAPDGAETHVVACAAAPTP